MARATRRGGYRPRAAATSRLSGPSGACRPGPDHERFSLRNPGQQPSGGPRGGARCRAPGRRPDGGGRCRHLDRQQTCTHPADLAELAQVRGEALRLRGGQGPVAGHPRRCRPFDHLVERARRTFVVATRMNRFAGLRLLGPYLRPHRGRVALALLSLLVAAGTVLAFGACLRALIDRGFAQARPDVLNYALASLLVVALVLAVASGARFYLVSWLGERVVGNLRRDLFAHVVPLGPAWFEIKRSGGGMRR